MKRILVAVDGSEHSAVAARCAIDWAKRTGAAVEGLHVVVPSALPETEDAPVELARRTGESLLGEVGEWAKASGIDFYVLLESGDVVDRIAYHSDMADLTVVGALGRSGDPARLLGSIALEVVREAIRPVLVVRGSPLPTRRVLIAYDRSDGAADALSWAGRWGADWEVLIVNGADYEPDGTVLVKQARRFLQNYGVEAQTRVLVPGDGAHAVFRASRDFEPDLILIGSRGRGAVARVLLGSTSEAVLEQAPCSVMVFR